jgi:hypothetical protein
MYTIGREYNLVLGDHCCEAGLLLGSLVVMRTQLVYIPIWGMVSGADPTLAGWTRVFAVLSNVT